MTSTSLWVEAIKRFEQGEIDKNGGQDSIALLYTQRRAQFHLFSAQLSDTECEALRPYLFPRPIPQKEGDPLRTCLNFIAGFWKKGEMVRMHSLADRRIPLCELVRSRDTEIAECIDTAYSFWSSLEWAEEGLVYRKHVIKNFSRLLHYYREECIDEIRHQIPKTRIEAEKDFWEAKRCADHIEGSAEKSMGGALVPTMIPGHTYWKDTVPAGICTVIAPMNFIYGISGIQIVGCYLSGSPLIFKGHPFAAITNTTLIKMMVAAGANPRSLYKLEGFGPDLVKLVSDPRIAVVSVTGSADTAKKLQQGRGVRPVRFEGGGCNWAYIDDGYTDEELNRIALRLSYSKLGFGAHKCTSLHGIAGSSTTLDRLENKLKQEFETYKIEDPRHSHPTETKVLSPCMVHKAATVNSIQKAAQAAGIHLVLQGGKIEKGEYAQYAEVVRPVILGRIQPDTRLSVDWDGEKKEIEIATTELFMPILVTMEVDSFEAFLRFCLLRNPHDLAVSLWTRDDRKLTRARRILAGMLKENDGTDSALDWEEFGASGIGESGNAGVGDAEATLSIFTRKQKGRHLTF